MNYFLPTNYQYTVQNHMWLTEASSGLEQLHYCPKQLSNRLLDIKKTEVFDQMTSDSIQKPKRSSE